MFPRNIGKTKRARHRPKLWSQVTVRILRATANRSGTQDKKNNQTRLGKSPKGSLPV